MISREYRTLAMNVASGQPLPQADEAGLRKVSMYGVVAKASSRLVMPTTAELLKSYNPRSVSHVTDLLGDELKMRYGMLLLEDRSLLGDLDEVIRKRRAGIEITTLGGHVLAMLQGGINTAMEMESVTLATIQSRIESGEQITESGLMKSQRIPFEFALQSLANLNLADDDLFQWTALKDVGNNGVKTKSKILRPEITSMTPNQGLILTGAIPQAELYPSVAGEPRIGCPVTMVKDFVRDLHAVAAETCVQSGIIPISEV